MVKEKEELKSIAKQILKVAEPLLKWAKKQMKELEIKEKEE